MQFLLTAPNTGVFEYQKAVCAFSGGLRCADISLIEYDDVEFNDVTGYWITYSVSKQHGQKIKNKFYVVNDGTDAVKQYMNSLIQSGVTEGRLFKSFGV